MLFELLYISANLNWRWRERLKCCGSREINIRMCDNYGEDRRPQHSCKLATLRGGYLPKRRTTMRARLTEAREQTTHHSSDSTVMTSVPHPSSPLAWTWWTESSAGAHDHEVQRFIQRFCCSEAFAKRSQLQVELLASSAECRRYSLKQFCYDSFWLWMKRLDLLLTSRRAEEMEYSAL